MWIVKLKTDEGEWHERTASSAEEACMLIAKFRVKYPTWRRYLKYEGSKL